MKLNRTDIVHIDPNPQLYIMSKLDHQGTPSIRRGSLQGMKSHDLLRMRLDFVLITSSIFLNLHSNVYHRVCPARLGVQMAVQWNSDIRVRDGPLCVHRYAVNLESREFLWEVNAGIQGCKVSEMHENREHIKAGLVLKYSYKATPVGMDTSSIIKPRNFCVCLIARVARSRVKSKARSPSPGEEVARSAYGSQPRCLSRRIRASYS